MLSLIEWYISHTCSHSKFSKSITPTPNLRPSSSYDSSAFPSSERLLQPMPWRPIRVTIDYSNINATGVSDEMIEYFSRTVVPTAVKTIQDTLQVRGYKEIYAFNTTGCDSLVTLPDTYKNKEIDTDLLLFVNLRKEEGNHSAWAVPCLYATYDKRPVMVVLQANLNSFVISQEKVSLDIASVLHELIHGIALSPTLYNMFPIDQSSIFKNVNIFGTVKSSVIAEEVIEYAREYFNCSNLEGVPLEFEGDDVAPGIHWEQNALGNELMASQANGHPVLSGFTLRLLKSIGWYKVDLDYSEQLYWGRNRTCTFLQNLCDFKFPEFCPIMGESSCTSDYYSKTYCTRSTFSDSCFLKTYKRNLDCTKPYPSFQPTLPTGFESLGPYSRCFETKSMGVSTSGCLPAICANDTVYFKASNVTYECDYSGAVMVIGTISVVCPDIQSFCQKLNATGPNDCSASGTSREDGGCNCDFFYSGKACENKLGCDEKSPGLCSKMTPTPIVELGAWIESAAVWGVISFLALVVIANF